MNIKNTIKQFTPPIILQAYRSMLGKHKDISLSGRGFIYGQNWQDSVNVASNNVEVGVPHGLDKGSILVPNPLEVYFDAHMTGKGVWKWRHYFDVYHRHLQKFIGREVHIVEIGVYSGGSLQMWREYFGDKCHVYGVDIEAACKVYENDSVKIFVGDQADCDFWRSFKVNVPRVDVVIDDGGHLSEQQIVSTEELLPFLQGGGVYICEDIHGVNNGYNSYISGLIQNLNTCDCKFDNDNPERHQYSRAFAFQSVIHSVHVYPYISVIEKRDMRLDELVCPKHGTEWQPFL